MVRRGNGAEGKMVSQKLSVLVTCSPGAEGACPCWEGGRNK